MIKLTKNELKKQKDNLKRFQKYLPTLKLKQQQLQTMLQKILHDIEELRLEYEGFFESVQPWLGVFGDEVATTLDDFIEDTEIQQSIQNIAGVDIPIYEDLKVIVSEYDLVDTPLWIDAGLEALIRVLKILAQIQILEEQYRCIEQELRTTIQRVNLFEKVKIPDTKHNIRVIQIYLGDQQTAAVVRGKITKARIVEV